MGRKNQVRYRVMRLRACSSREVMSMGREEVPGPSPGEAVAEAGEVRRRSTETERTTWKSEERRPVSEMRGML